MLINYNIHKFLSKTLTLKHIKQYLDEKSAIKNNHL